MLNDTIATTLEQYQKATSTPTNSPPASAAQSKRQFIKVYHHLYQFDLNFQCLNLYALLLNYSDEKLLSHARQAVLCDTLGLSRTQLYENVQKLKDKGLVEVGSVKGYAGVRRNTYQLVWYGGKLKGKNIAVPTFNMGSAHSQIPIHMIGLIKSDGDTLSLGAVHVCAYLQWLDKQKYDSWDQCPSHADLAKLFNRSKPAIRRYLRELEDAGALVRVRERNKLFYVGRATNLYQVLWSGSFPQAQQKVIKNRT